MRTSERAKKRVRTRRGERAGADVDRALDSIPADELRRVIRDLLLELDERAHGRVVHSLIDRAARRGSGWTPAPVEEARVAEVLAFANAARHVGRADPADVDDALSCGSKAFLQGDYAAACKIFGALLPPVGDGDIDLGQHELADEVLGVDTADCAAQHVVSAYMIAPEAERAEAVRAAIVEVRGFGNFWEPLQEMDRVAVKPLPGLSEFLPRWRALIAGMPARGRRGDWDTDEDRWLREVSQRLEGAGGLAKIARSTRRAEDLRAWCRSLVVAADWKSALAAYEEASGVFAGEDCARGEFLDGAALAAQMLGRKDLPARLERAWRADPSFLRLRRWLGSANGKATLRKRVDEAIEACPKQAVKQRALLHVLARDFEAAARLLATAPGLGWSDGEHPGHLLFPLFARLLGKPLQSLSAGVDLSGHRSLDLEELQALTVEDGEPRLDGPEVEHLVALAGLDTIVGSSDRATVVAAMRKAAETRVACLTAEKRRRHYGHAAGLVATCVMCDGTSHAARWVAKLRSDYGRFPALRDELDRALGREATLRG